MAVVQFGACSAGVPTRPLWIEPGGGNVVDSSRPRSYTILPKLYDRAVVRRATRVLPCVYVSKGRSLGRSRCAYRGDRAGRICRPDPNFGSMLPRGTMSYGGSHDGRYLGDIKQSARND